jgi:hypothetical protein
MSWWRMPTKRRNFRGRGDFPDFGLWWNSVHDRTSSSYSFLIRYRRFIVDCIYLDCSDGMFRFWIQRKVPERFSKANLNSHSSTCCLGRKSSLDRDSSIYDRYIPATTGSYKLFASMVRCQYCIYALCSWKIRKTVSSPIHSTECLPPFFPTIEHSFFLIGTVATLTVARWIFIYDIGSIYMTSHLLPAILAVLLIA